jgi:hypothetical protein
VFSPAREFKGTLTAGTSTAEAFVAIAADSLGCSIGVKTCGEASGVSLASVAPSTGDAGAVRAGWSAFEPAAGLRPAPAAAGAEASVSVGKALSNPAGVSD